MYYILHTGNTLCSYEHNNLYVYTSQPSLQNIYVYQW